MADFATEGGHWYKRDGAPFYTITGRDGKDRATTLRDARKLDLVPSVTTIMGMAHRPSLERYKINQAVLAALTLPRIEGEGSEAFLARVDADAKEHARKAAEVGTNGHAALEMHFRGLPHPIEFSSDVAAAEFRLCLECGVQDWATERSFAHEAGYGGKVDLHSPAWVVDFKFKAFGPADLPRAWDEHPMQVSAYRRGLRVPDAKCGILFVSTLVPGLVHFVPFTEAELARGLVMFDALLTYYRAKNDL